MKYDDSKWLFGCQTRWCHRGRRWGSERNYKDVAAMIRGSMLFLLTIWALRQVGCETVGHSVTNAIFFINLFSCPYIPNPGHLLCHLLRQRRLRRKNIDILV